MPIVHEGEQPDLRFGYSINHGTQLPRELNTKVPQYKKEVTKF